MGTRARLALLALAGFAFYLSPIWVAMRRLSPRLAQVEAQLQRIEDRMVCYEATMECGVYGTLTIKGTGATAAEARKKFEEAWAEAKLLTGGK